MPTLVATMAAPTKMASIWPAPQASRMPQPIRKGTITPATATRVAVPPTFEQLGGFHFQAHAEQQEHDAEIGQRR